MVKKTVQQWEIPKRQLGISVSTATIGEINLLHDKTNLNLLQMCLPPSTLAEQNQDLRCDRPPHELLNLLLPYGVPRDMMVDDPEDLCFVYLYLPKATAATASLV